MILGEKQNTISNWKYRDKWIEVLQKKNCSTSTRAAMAAGYSKNVACIIGWENLRKPNIQVEIERQKERITSELGLNIQRVVAEYMKIVFTDMTDLLSFKEGQVHLKPSSEVDGGVIAEVKEGKHGVTIILTWTGPGCHY
jgi:phage terminase small subunit